MSPKFAKYFFILGGIITIIGLFFIVWAIAESNDIESDNTRPPLQFDYPNNGVFSTGDDNKTTIQFKFIFKTDTEFAVGERFNYNFQAKVGGPDIIEKIYIIFETSNIDSSEINDKNLESVLNYAIENELGVELEKNGLMDDLSILFEHKSTYLFPKEQEVKLIPVTVGKNNEYDSLPKTGSLFTIKPFSEKLSVEAGQKSIKSSKQQELDGRKNIGLTIIAISIAAYGLGIQLLISKRKGDDDKSIQSLDNGSEQPPSVNNSIIEARLSTLEKTTHKKLDYIIDTLRDKEPTITKIFQENWIETERQEEIDQLRTDLDKKDEKIKSQLNLFLKEANSYHFEKKYGKAVELYDIILNESPNHLGLLNNKGLALAQLEKYEEAIICYNKALKIEAKNPSVLSNKGNVLTDLGKFKDAILCYNSALETNPKFVNAITAKGTILDTPNESISLYNEALEIDPKNFAALNNKGVALIELGKFDEAILFYNKALEIQSNDDTLKNKGNALVTLGDLKEAISCYDKALKENPKNVDALIGKGNVLDSQEKFTDALICYNDALDITPTNIKALTNKGVALANLGKFEDAISYHDKALKENPNFVLALNNKSYALANLDDYAEALSLAERALEIDEEFVEAWINKGLALAKLNKITSGLSCINKALKIEPDNFLANTNKGNLLFMLEKYDEAIFWYDKALTIQPTNSATINNKNIALTKIKESKK